MRMHLRLPKRERCGVLTPLSKIEFTLVTHFLPCCILSNKLASKFVSLTFQISGIEIEDFTEISMQLVEPLEDFFNNVFVMVVS